jgi:DNA-binding CsgD family transcriptional regulator
LTLPDRRLLDIIDDIYQASVEPEAWQRVVDGIHSLLPAAGVDVQGYYQGDYLIVQRGHDPDFIEEYKRSYAGSNPWASHIHEMPVGVPVIMAESPYLPEVLRTDWQRFMEENSAGYGIGLPVLTEPDRLFFLVIQYAAKWTNKLDPSAAELARRLARHLGRSFDISIRLGAAQSPAAGLPALLERAGAPILVVDSSLRLRHATRQGEALLAAGNPLRTEPLGRIALSNPEAQAAFAAAVRSCVRGELAGAAPSLFAVASPSGPQRIVVVPLAADSAISKGPVGRFFAERLAMLLVLTASGSNDPLAAARKRFGLTAAEGELARALCGGDNLRDYAARRGVTLATVRNQLKSVFSKTDTHRQGELIALLLKLGGAAGAE